MNYNRMNTIHWVKDGVIGLGVAILIASGHMDIAGFVAGSVFIGSLVGWYLTRRPQK